MAKTEHTHTYKTLPDAEDVTHDHVGGYHGHIHNGLTDDDYLKRVKARETKAKAKK